MKARSARRQPRPVPGRAHGWWTALAPAALVAGLLAGLTAAPTTTAGEAGAAEPALHSSTAATPPSQAETSTRGVSKTAINVVFPVVAINSLAGKLGFAEDKEYDEQSAAIHLYVNQINKSGGINGRKINPMVVQFDPQSDANMQSLCQQWTQGNPAVFAVVDGIGTWEQDNQLCITQQGHTPLISAWSATTDWTNLGSPYLWWTGPDMAPVLQATVQWGLSSGRLGHGKKVGVVVSDQAADQAALNSTLLPDLKKAGITPQVDTVAGNPDETSTTNSQAQLAVERLKAAGVQSVFPLLPENAFFPYLASEGSQQYYPQLLLSDYQSTIEVALGLIPTPYGKELNGQQGVTTETLGGIDDDRPEAQGGYDPGVRSCYATWHAYHPKPIPGTLYFYIEEQGPIQGWCGAIRLFATAAKDAGPNLNRRTFVEAMSKITDYPGTLSPVWSFGPNKFYGPTQYQVVKVHDNHPPTALCKMPKSHRPQGVCWVTVQPFRPLPGLASNSGSGSGSGSGS